MLARNRSLELVVCPCCHERLSSFSACSSCGAEFARSDSIPSLIPVAAEREVRFPFDSSRSVPGDEFRQAFRWPARTGYGSLPGLDIAHAALLEELEGGSSVLEIGCGGGQMRDYLARRGVHYVGVDIAAGDRVAEGLRAYGGPDLLADAHFLPFSDKQFDLVYSAAVMEHLACPQLAAQEAARVLKPGGRFVGSVSFLEPWHDDSFYNMTPLAVFELMTQAGLRAEYVWPGYSGFTAIFMMGNKATRALTLIGNLCAAIYRLGNRVRGRNRTIEDEARVAGAMNWIAVKP